MAANELAARRWFRQRLDEIGQQYPELRSPEARERLTAELERQAGEGDDVAEANEGMAEVSRRGRPKGSRTSTVDLETISFKAPVEFMARLRVYAKQRRQSLSELIRDGLEWRLSEVGDPLTLRSGELGGEEAPAGPGLEAVIESLSILAEEVRQLREEVREARVGGISGNIGSAGEAGHPEVIGTGHQEVVELGLDPEKWQLGKLCKGKHAYPGKSGRTLYRLPGHVCPKCDADRSRERRARKRAERERAARERDVA